MDWNEFFERTRVAAGVESFSKLAPMLGITDGAIGHYRQGRRVPQVWVVADALRIQGHPEPEKAAIEIMKRAALTSPERTFWKRLAATTAVLAMGVLGAMLAHGGAPGPGEWLAYLPFAAIPLGGDVHYAKWMIGLALAVVLLLRSDFARYIGQCLWIWLAHRLHRPKPSPDNVEAFAWI